MKEPSTWTIRWATRIAEIDRGQWDRLAVPLATPLLEWEWLHAMEASGSIAPPNGWQPYHLTVWSADRLIAAAPLYIKTHSSGEFVFDQWWARLAAGISEPYYPKLVGMSPATPAVGYRFLIDPEQSLSAVLAFMLRAIDDLCVTLKLSVCQFNFIDADWIVPLQEAGFTAWRHQSFLWRNPGYMQFEDYLHPFKSTQRRNIRRERRSMADQGIEIRSLESEEIDPRLSNLMFRYYLNTNAQFGDWAARFLNADFFYRIFQSYRKRLVIMAAHRPSEGQPVGLSMLLRKGGRLIGRYWGCAEPLKNLHFNLCFYAPLAWAIDNRIEEFDPGAGSPHKLARGFAAVANVSLHRFYRPRLKLLFNTFIDRVNQAEGQMIHDLNRLLPFARRPDQSSGSMDI
jgi:predicted N-acyltransferase